MTPNAITTNDAVEVVREISRSDRGAPPSARSLADFLDDGGFPAFLRERNLQTLQELLRDIVQRDIAGRYRLRETRHVMNLVLFLLANTGQPYSLQGLTKSLQIPTVAQTSRYVEYAQDAYLLFAVPKFSPSFKKRVVTPNKYYAVDNGLRRANSPQATADVGHRLENAIFLALRRQKESVCYAGEKDRWDSISVDGAKVEVLPAWEWLANPAIAGTARAPTSPR